MKLTTALMSASALLLLSAPALAADAPSDAVKAITANYALSCTAVLDPTDKNVDSWFASYTSDFTNLDLKGKSETKDELMATVKQQLKQFHGTSCDNTPETPSATDANTVVVVNTNKVLGDIQGPSG